VAEILNILTGIGLPVILILLGWFAGRAAERRHLNSLARRERQLRHILVTDIRSFPMGADPDKTPALVMGQAVIAADYIKLLLAAIRKIFGGELHSYRSLMSRARREAILRMLEQAHSQGYNAVCNLRLNTADIGGMAIGRGLPIVETLATGTAYYVPGLSGPGPAP